MAPLNRETVPIVDYPCSQSPNRLAKKCRPALLVG